MIPERMRGRSLQHRRLVLSKSVESAKSADVFMVNDKRVAALDVLAWLLLMWLLLQGISPSRFEGWADLRIHPLFGSIQHQGAYAGATQ